jgi:hypothetical protein
MGISWMDLMKLLGCEVVNWYGSCRYGNDGVRICNASRHCENDFMIMMWYCLYTGLSPFQCFGIGGGYKFLLHRTNMYSVRTVKSENSQAYNTNTTQGCLIYAL